jgi:hypothetical protein
LNVVAPLQVAIMETLRQRSTAERLAAMAGLVAATAAFLGFIPGVYRDPGALVVQSNGQDLATLVVGVPVLGFGLWASVRGSLRGRLVALGALAYLLYTYTVYAFVSVLGPLTALDIAVVGLAGWSLALASGALPDSEVETAVGPHLHRRATGFFLLAIATLFGLLWLSQIASAAMTGVLPQALIDAGWPTNPIYVLDLAFLLPLCALTGVRLLTHRPGAARLAVPLLVFAPLLSLGVLSISAFAAADGQPLEVVQAAIFVVTTVVGAALAFTALVPRTRHSASSSPDGVAA